MRAVGLVDVARWASTSAIRLAVDWCVPGVPSPNGVMASTMIVIRESMNSKQPARWESVAADERDGLDVSMAMKCALQSKDCPNPSGATPWIGAVMVERTMSKGRAKPAKSTEAVACWSVQPVRPPCAVSLCRPGAYPRPAMVKTMIAMTE